MTFDPKHLLQAVAAKLLQKRRELNWSQQDLAERSQVSRRMIGLIEGGESNASLATLGHLAAALGITFSEMVGGDTSSEADRGRPERGLQLWQGSLPGTRVDLLHSFPASRSVELWKWTIAPGDRYQGEPDLPGYREMLYVIRGSLSLERDEGTQLLKAGDAIAFPSDRPYAFVNNGKSNLVFVLNVVA
jgi:transcriptional regulator with XRE-family HTH domain